MFDTFAEQTLPRHIAIKKVQVLIPRRGQAGCEPLRLKLDVCRGFGMISIPKRTNSATARNSCERLKTWKTRYFGQMH